MKNKKNILFITIGLILICLLFLYINNQNKQTTLKEALAAEIQEYEITEITFTDYRGTKPEKPSVTLDEKAVVEEFLESEWFGHALDMEIKQGDRNVPMHHYEITLKTTHPEQETMLIIFGETDMTVGATYYEVLNGYNQLIPVFADQF